MVDMQHSLSMRVSFLFFFPKYSFIIVILSHNYKIETLLLT